MKLANQLLVIGAVNKVTKINGDPWCTRREIKDISGLESNVVSSSLENLLDQGLIEQYKNGYRQSIWVGNHSKFISLMDKSQIAMLVVQDQIIKFANEKILSLMKYTREKASSKPFIDFVHSEEVTVLTDRHAARLRGEDVPNVYTTRLVDGDGQVNKVDVRVSHSLWCYRPAMLTLFDNFMRVGCFIICGALSLMFLINESILLK